jgi:hypothetical protein
VVPHSPDCGDAGAGCPVAERGWSASPCRPHAEYIRVAPQPAFMRTEEEDDMPRTQSLTCALCGLRYADGRLLELHIREDHVRRNHQAPPDRSTPSYSGTCQPAPEAHPTAPPPPPASAPVEIMAAETAAPRSRRRLSEAPITSLTRAARGGRRAIRVLRHVNDELLRASGAILRSARFPQPGPHPEAPTRTDAHPGPDKTEQGNRAA